MKYAKTGIVNAKIKSRFLINIYACLVRVVQFSEIPGKWFISVQFLFLNANTGPSATSSHTCSD